ncbi:integrin alpha-E [Sphaerodactylus townsendi]|uniref:integrin alpha-E n=1 Tax=Sphaerodactylus townsendi TaxID=933632 RepID=UPI0020268B52|nr:integrin alpha-E [Sphaerodactylus townsendi]
MGSFNIDTSQSWVSPSTSPHFGYQVLQHSDGRRSWILATSLGPGDPGRLYKCSLQEDFRCEEANLGENIQKLRKIRPGIALAQNSEQILACVQQKRRQRRKAMEELNGLCVVLANDFQEKAFINLTDIIETKLNQSSRLRRKRSCDGDSPCHADTDASRPADHAGDFPDATTSACQDPHVLTCREDPRHKIRNANNNNNYMVEEEEEDDSDLQTEIAIVLDGSGSIEPEDFERAKDFIRNILKTFYEKCFECAFALVQYGDVIQTEFDLRVGRDANTALAKVQDVTQVGKVTRTASAIQHVLDSIFHESHGSQKNAAKIIVVLTDGDIFQDPMNLTAVINSKNMEGIDRYAIGVGNVFNNKKSALDELRLIASDPDETHLFQVTNYSALNGLLSTLQQKIIGIEGTAGDVLEFELAQSGFSAHFLDERHILFGTVGAFDWSGGILLYEIASKTAVFLNESKKATGGRNNYLGYSVVAVSTGRGPLIVAGAPRHSMTGRVMVFEGDLLKQTLPGEQIGYGAFLRKELKSEQSLFRQHLLFPFLHCNSVTRAFRSDPWGVRATGRTILIVGVTEGIKAVKLSPDCVERPPEEAAALLKETLLAEELRSPKITNCIGSYFGAELCSLDVDQDGLTDYLLVGAPFFHVLGEEGKVYIYRFDGKSNLFTLKGHVSGQPSLAFASFGFAMASIGDVDQDGYGDVAIGAPLENHNAAGSSFGSVYIYNGRKDGIQASFSQRITAAQVGPGLMHFGRSVAGGLDFTQDSLPDIAVGSLGRVTLLRSRPVLRLAPAMQFTPERISNFRNSSTVDAELCFHRDFSLEMARPGMQNLIIRFTVDLDVEMEKKRAHFEDHTASYSSEIYFTERPCTKLQLYILPCNDNCFSSIAVRLHYQLSSSREDRKDPMPILDINQPSVMYFQLPYKEDCNNKTVCSPRLTLAVHTKKELVVGVTKDLTMTLHLANTGDNSYMTSVLLEYPANLGFKKVQEQFSSAAIDCDAPRPTKPQFSSLNCKIGHPVFRTTADFSVTWQVEEKKFPDDSPSITVNLSNINPNSPALLEEHFFNVKYAFTAFLSRTDHSLYVSMSETASRTIRLEFNITGKNPYGAPLELQVWVPALVTNHQIIHVKDATGTQNTTICRTASDFRRRDFGHVGSESSETIQYQLVNCFIMSEKENVTVTAELALVNALQVFKTTTALWVTGEIIFDRNLYVGLNEKHHETQIDVVLLKEKDFDYLPVIMASSAVGILLLALIVVILYKGGFFKKNHRKMLEEQNNSNVEEDSNSE